MDPTFTRQLAIAVQSDILRQAARDRQRGQAREEGGERPARLVTPTRRLALAIWRYIACQGNLRAPLGRVFPTRPRPNS